MKKPTIEKPLLKRVGKSFCATFATNPSSTDSPCSITSKASIWKRRISHAIFAAELSQGCKGCVSTRPESTGTDWLVQITLVQNVAENSSRVEHGSSICASSMTLSSPRIPPTTNWMRESSYDFKGYFFIEIEMNRIPSQPWPRLLLTLPANQNRKANY